MIPPAWTVARLTVRRIWAILTLFALAASLACAIVQTARLEGFSVWPFSMSGWIETAGERQKTIDRMISAQDEAQEKARVARIDQEATYRDIAERIDDNAKTNLQAAMAAADRFIAAGGMREQAAGNSRCSAGTAAGDRRAANPGRTGRTPQLDAKGDRLAAGSSGIEPGFVVVSAEDVRICTRNTIKAEAGHQLATQLKEASQTQKDNGKPASPDAAARQGELGMPAPLRATNRTGK